MPFGHVGRGGHERKGNMRWRGRQGLVGGGASYSDVTPKQACGATRTEPLPTWQGLEPSSGGSFTDRRRARLRGSRKGQASPRDIEHERDEDRRGGDARCRRPSE